MRTAGRKTTGSTTQSWRVPLLSRQGAYNKGRFLIIPNFDLFTGIDIVRLTIKPIAIQTLKTKLGQAGFHPPGNLDDETWTSKLHNKRCAKFVNDFLGVNLEVLYWTRPIGGYWPRHTIQVHRPTHAFIAVFDQMFLQLGTVLNVSYIELAFDFHTDDLTEMRTFIDDHVFLKNAKRKPFMIRETTYTADAYDSAKATRHYNKPIDDPEFVRLELIINSTKGIHWPLDMLDKDFQVNRYFDFRRLNLDKLKAYYRPRLEKELSQEPVRRTKSGKSRQLSIGSRMYWFPCPHKFLMADVHWMKSHSIGNYLRFLEPMNEFNEWFSTAIKRRKFIPRAGDPLQSGSVHYPRLENYLAKKKRCANGRVR